VAAAESGGQLQIWDLETSQLLSEFATVFDGCNRLAVSSAGDLVVTANWRKGKKAGVACYETANGKLIWHRTDLGQIQHMTFSAQGDRIWCEIDSRPVHCLDSKSGSTLKIWRAVQDVIDSPSHTLAVRKQQVLIEGEKSVSVPRLTRSGLEAALGPDCACICEAWNPTIRPVPTTEALVRCIDCETGIERWRYRPPSDHFIGLISDQDDGSFCAIQTGCEGNKWIVALIRLSAEDGTPILIRSLEAPPPYFGGFGDGIFVTPHGEVISLKTGENTKKLDFK